MKKYLGQKKVLVLVIAIALLALSLIAFFILRDNKPKSSDINTADGLNQEQFAGCDESAFEYVAGNLLLADEEVVTKTQEQVAIIESSDNLNQSASCLALLVEYYSRLAPNQSMIDYHQVYSETYSSLEELDPRIRNIANEPQAYSETVEIFQKETAIVDLEFSVDAQVAEEPIND